MADYDALRPEETALDRIKWLGLYGVEFDEGEGAIVMDEIDYRGQPISIVAEDCAQITGRRFWIETTN